MLKHIFTALLLVTCISSYAQCSVSKEEEDNEVIYSARFEEYLVRKGINNDGDLSQGFQIAYVRILALGEEKDLWVMQIASTNAGRLPKVIPRRVYVKNNYLTSAIIESEAYFTNDGQDIYEFILTAEHLKILQSPIHTFDLIDSRTNTRTNIRPVYDKLIAEQIACIQRR